MKKPVRHNDTSTPQKSAAGKAGFVRLAIAAGVFAIGTVLLLTQRQMAGVPSPEGSAQANLGGRSGCATRAYSEIGGPISLIDQNGERRTEADFRGSPSLVYFGFTFCPDVCPTTLAKLDRALEQLPAGTPRPRPILISIDPARDTPEALKLYLSTPAFPQDTVGLTGTEEEIKAATTAFKAAAWRIDQPDSAAGYTMGHTDIVYLMNPDWTLSTFFTMENTPEQMAICIAERLEG
jgi:protein SCO1/2